MNGAGDYHFKGHAAVIYMRCRRVPALNGDKYDMGRTFRAAGAAQHCRQP